MAWVVEGLSYYTGPNGEDEWVPEGEFSTEEEARTWAKQMKTLYPRGAVFRVVEVSK